MKKISLYALLAIFFGCFFNDVKAQQYSDGNINVQLTVYQLWRHSYGDAGFGDSEDSYQIQLQDKNNLDGSGWLLPLNTGSSNSNSCFQDGGSGGSYPRTYTTNRSIINYNYTTNSPMYYEINYDTWEDDRGNRCKFDGNGNIFQDDDDDRCGPGTITNLPIRSLGAPCVDNYASWQYFCGSTNNNSTAVKIKALYTMPIPQVSLTTNTCDITLNSSINGAGSYAGVSFSWERNGAGVVGSTQNLTTTTPGSYRVTYSNGTCTNTSAWIIVSTIPLPIIIASADASVCIGESTTISASGATSYTWDNGLGAGNPKTVSPTSITTYTVTGTDGNGCQNTDQVTVSVNPIPNITASTTNNTICNGASTTISASGASSYTWDNGLGAGNPKTVSPTSNTTYTVTGIDGNGCQNTDQVSVSVNPLPVLAITSVSVLCIDAAAITLIGAPTGGTFTGTGVSGSSFDPATAGAGTHTITYSYTDGNSCSASTTIDITVNSLPTPSITPVSALCIDAASVTLVGSPTGGTFSGTGVSGTSFDPATAGLGTYTITYTYTDGNSCSASITIDITVNPLPTPSITSVSALCFDAAAVTLVGSPTGGTFSGTGVSGTSFDPATAGDGAHTITYTYTDENSCSASTTTGITVNPLPTYTVSSTDPSCGNSDGEIVITPGSGITITDYSIDNGATTQSGGTFSNLAAGSYMIYVKDNNGCEATQTLSLSNAGSPSIDNIDTTRTSCTANDGTITITASGGTGAIQYSTDNGVTFQVSGSFTGLGAGTYNIVVKDNNGCETNGTATINQMNAPDLTLVSSQNITCNGDNDGSIEVAANGGTIPYTYSWSPNVSTSGNATNLSAGNYTVTVTDDAGCTDNLQVTINELDTIAIAEIITSSDCGQSNGSVTLQVTGGDGSYTFVWNPNVSTSATATGLTAESYGVTVTDGNGCTQTGTYNVGMSGSFSLDIVPDYITINQGESIDIHLTIDPSITFDSIIWSPTEGLSCTDCDNPVASPGISTTYYVKVISTDGCSSMDSVAVHIKSPCAKIYVPTSFSPNGDGMNDLECVMGDCIATLDFAIYNRWGEIVFQTADLKQCWDGLFRGKLAQTGVYVYKLKAKLNSGEEIEESGNINVVK